MRGSGRGRRGSGKGRRGRRRRMRGVLIDKDEDRKDRDGQEMEVLGLAIGNENPHT